MPSAEHSATPVSDFKGIPIVPAAEPQPRSGDKYRTPQGFTAIKDGIKAAAAVGSR